MLVARDERLQRLAKAQGRGVYYRLGDITDCCIPVPPAFLRSTSEAGKDRVFGQYYPSSGYIFGKAPNILEFELGKFLCDCLTQSDLERFLKLEWVHQARPSFSSKDQLLAWVASLPTGPKWCSTTLEMTRYPTIQPINLIWRNGLEVVQDLFANPIFANHMTYDPHVVIDGDERKYSEYFTAQQAFEIQDQLPEGATIVPMIIASDKTPVTRHTGGLEMHPIFVTIGNIQSDVWMRATCQAWRCVAYMPIPKFIDVHPDYQTILSQQLFHKCMDIIFADTKVTVMVGKFMPNPAGHQAIACVSKVASPITLATSQSFEFQEEAKAHSLSGVHQPFWRNWRHSDPSRFLVGEILHTCHKFFFDHPFKWCKESVGKDELDILCQMKQMTGREHRDLQRTLVPSITGVVPPQFVHAQSPVYSDTSIDSMVASLKEFHDHKHAILDAGTRRGTRGTLDNFIILKLELLQSFASFTKDTGALIQWTADVTERLLITHCKHPFERTSRQSRTFTEQIIDILNREESMWRFQLYLFLRMHDSPLANAIVTEEQEVTETDPALAWITRVTPNDPNQRCFVGLCPVRNHFLKGILSSTATAAFHVTVAPDRAKMSLNEIQQLYALPDFGRALSDYIAKASGGQFTTAWSNDRGRLKTWNKFRLQLHSVFRSRMIMPSQVVQAAPPSEKFPLGNCNAVITQYGDQTVNLVAQVRAVFQPIVPRHITLPHYLADQPLLYVQYYEIVENPGNQPAISMYTVARKYQEGPTGQWMRLGAVIPLTDVTHAVELIPVYGQGANHTVYERFYLNNFSDKEVYHLLRSDLH
ncbi:hypothetical protein EV702DRAFT_1177149 [Suillus placidus]|uniref:DUF6830 domain-containing protein n=1 Tax=Suillus placidus TaxID=48579 RepID=A0A9P7D7P4_9AGAM|nr:hypothetical protein EV702DRAFT_1177149 [Suillus placidus]